jgi:hypothetical protein
VSGDVLRLGLAWFGLAVRVPEKPGARDHFRPGVPSNFFSRLSQQSM